MFGKESCISVLAARRQLLVAESEINRVRLGQEWQALTDEANQVVHRAKSFTGMATSILSLIAAVGVFTRPAPTPATAKTSWLQKISSGVRLASTVWLLFRPRGSNSEKK